MPTNAEVKTAIENRLDTTWADQDVGIRFEMDPRKLPVGAYIRCSIRSTRGGRAGIAGGKILYRRQGWIALQCFAPINQDVAAPGPALKAKQIADDVVAIFEGQQFSGVTCRESEIQELGNDNNGFYQVAARVFFDFDFEREVN